MDIAYLIHRSAQRFRHKTCVVDGDTRLTFEEANRRGNQFANAMLDAGWKTGDRAAVLLSNEYRFIEIYCGLAKAGVARIPLNARDSWQDNSDKIANCRTNGLIFGEEFLEFVMANAQAWSTVRWRICVSGDSANLLPDGILDYEKAISSGSPAEPPTTVDPDVIYRMSHTGGTTGRAKPVITTHRTEFELITNLLLSVVPFQGDDVFLHVHPLTHGTACFVLPCIVRGAPQVITAGPKPRRIMEVIQAERVTSSFMVPSTIISLLDDPHLPEYDLGSLRRVIYGASPMPVARIRQAIRTLGPVFGQIYGQAEIPICATFLSPEEHILEGPEHLVRRLESCGRESDRVMVRIVDENDRTLPCDQIGEVAARSSHMMVGYWNNPEETERTLRGGWVHTGDMGWMDEDGYVYLVDRKHDMIISGGFNVYPKEVEEVLYRHPGVREAAVIGVPDRKWGEAVKALVALKEGESVTEEALLRFCRGFLGGYKTPKSVDFYSGELPKTAVGKIDKKRLKQDYWKGEERSIH